MTTKKLPFIFLFLAALTAAALFAVSPTAALPPRPTPPPLPPQPPAGGLIVLTAVSPSPVIPDALWTRVQWQDPQGVWREVDGWRGAFSPDLTVTWWVAPEDLNTGPFRWLVYPDENSSSPLAVSAPFYLPPDNKQTTAVTVTLP